MAIDTLQLKDYIITPTLKYLNLWSESAEMLLLGTCAQESGMGEYLHQVQGPALGVFQMEPATHTDIWKNYLGYNVKYSTKIIYLMSDYDKSNPLDALISNLAYATSMARIHYLRVKAPLPNANDLDGLAHYWKQYYNTPKGRGKVSEFKDNWNRYVKPYF